MTDYEPRTAAYTALRAQLEEWQTAWDERERSLLSAAETILDLEAQLEQQKAVNRKLQQKLLTVTGQAADNHIRAERYEEAVRGLLGDTTFREDGLTHEEFARAALSEPSQGEPRDG